MGCVALVICVLVLRCGLAGVVCDGRWTWFCEGKDKYYEAIWDLSGIRTIIFKIQNLVKVSYTSYERNNHDCHFKANLKAQIHIYHVCTHACTFWSGNPDCSVFSSSLPPKCRQCLNWVTMTSFQILPFTALPSHSIIWIYALLLH